MFPVLLAISLGACSSPPPPPTTESIVVATRDLPPGTRVTPADIAQIEAPIGLFPAQVAREPAQAVNQRVRIPIHARDPMRNDALMSASRLPSTLGASVPPGQRAIEIPVEDPSPRPGQRVDLWWAPGGAPQCTVAQAVTVAAAPGRPPYAQPQGRAMVYVDPADVVSVIRASSDPTFRVTERDPRDPDVHPSIACSP
jgi:Flp pilus assembly protein CpaB